MDAQRGLAMCMSTYDNGAIGINRSGNSFGLPVT